jgi:hypothetical protein
MSKIRTDVHAPASASFDPSLYDCYGCYDNSPDGFFGEDPLRLYREEIKSLVARGYTCGRGCKSVCGHCGAGIRYFALLVRDDVKQFIHCGEQCLDNRFEVETAADFQALRKAAKLNRERANRDERIEALRQNPAIARLLDGGGDVEASEFLSDVRSKALEHGRLSDGQIAAVERAFARIARLKQWAAERRAEAQRLAAAGVRAPEGRVEVTGVVLSAKEQQSQFGTAIKIVVKSDEGWKVWTTAPSSLLTNVDPTAVKAAVTVIEEVREALVGKRIRFTAALTRSDSDAAFAFGKRPTKASLVSA